MFNNFINKIPTKAKTKYKISIVVPSLGRNEIQLFQANVKEIKNGSIVRILWDCYFSR